MPWKIRVPQHGVQTLCVDGRSMSIKITSGCAARTKWIRRSSSFAVSKQISGHRVSSRVVSVEWAGGDFGRVRELSHQPHVSGCKDAPVTRAQEVIDIRAGCGVVGHTRRFQAQAPHRRYTPDAGPDNRIASQSPGGRS